MHNLHLSNLHPVGFKGFIDRYYYIKKYDYFYICQLVV